MAKKEKEHPSSLYIVQGICMFGGIFFTYHEPRFPWWVYLVITAAGYGIGYLSLFAKTIVDLFFPPVMHFTRPPITYLYVTFLVRYILPPFLTGMVLLLIAVSLGID